MCLCRVSSQTTAHFLVVIGQLQGEPWCSATLTVQVYYASLLSPAVDGSGHYDHLPCLVRHHQALCDVITHPLAPV